jgi:serine-type D-Ala-D-Ala carboxypeptidase (penicillin-binding protein 5/6)
VRRAASAALAAAALAGCGSDDGGGPRAPRATPEPGAALDLGAGPTPLAVRLADPRDTVRVRFKDPPAAGLLFDVDTGRVLWRLHPLRRRPIASLTKIMTALVAERRLDPGRRVRVTREALDTTGSAVGLFRAGKRVAVSVLLHGLLLPSGNDAARILAQAAARGSIRRFVRMMNDEASRLGLRCSHFNTPSGLEDARNRSCAADLAAMSRALLRVPRLARIVGRRQAIMKFPIKGGRIYLANHNPLLLARYPGITGVKTGYTDAAGSCFVATARRGSAELGVVLLDSPDIDRQARKLLDRGFARELA